MGCSGGDRLHSGRAYSEVRRRTTTTTTMMMMMMTMMMMICQQEQIEWAVQEGADFIVAETFSELGEAKLALEAIQHYGHGERSRQRI